MKVSFYVAFTILILEIKNIAKREYFPCWLKKNGDEVFQENRGHVSWTAFTESFHISSLLFHPFALTKRHRIPSDIVEKLMLDQYATPILVFEEHIPLVNMLQCSLKAGDSDFQLEPENLGDE